jgi:hypothetical protein
LNNKKISFFLVGFFLSGLSFFLTEEALGKFCPTAQIECTSYTTGKKTTYPVLKIGEDCTPLKKGSFSIEEGVVNCEKSGGSPRFLEAPSDKEYNFSGKASVPQKNTVGEVNTVITAVSGIVGLKNISEKNKKSLKPYEISGKKAKLQKKIGDMNQAYLEKINTDIKKIDKKEINIGKSEIVKELKNKIKNLEDQTENCAKAS